MDISFSPASTKSAPTSVPVCLELNRFILAANSINPNEVSYSELLRQIGNLLVQHANCEILFDIHTADSRQETEPSMHIVASKLEECPQNVQQWAFTAATKTVTTGQTTLEDSKQSDSKSVAMVSIQVVPNSDHVLSAMFLGRTADEYQPFMQFAIQRILQWQTTNHLQQAQQTALDTASLQEICMNVGDSATVETGCRRLANNLQERLAVQTDFKVYIGKVSGEKFPKLVCVSGADSLPDNDRLIEAIESAMAECISRNVNTQWPATENIFASMCHKTVSRLLENNCVYSYVLPDREGKSQGVLFVQSPSPLDQRAENFLNTAQNQIGAALSLVERAEQNKLQKLVQRIKKTFTEKKTQTVLKLLAAVLLLGMIPLPYQIKTTAEVQPAEKMFLYSPFPAPLKESLVEPGDLVLKGAELARLDDKELSLELAEVQAKLHRSQKTHDGFVATHEPGEARLASHESEMLQARLEILQQRSEQLVLRSPIDGVVIAGDWKNAAGMPLETGQSLFEIAPLEKLSIDVFIPDDDIRYAKANQRVKIKFDSHPFESFHGSLNRIHPSAEIKDANNVFVATVLIDNPNGKLRPGMKGNAKCSSVWRPTWWNLFHKPAAKCMRYFGW